MHRKTSRRILRKLIKKPVQPGPFFIKICFIKTDWKVRKIQKVNLVNLLQKNQKRNVKIMSVRCIESNDIVTVEIWRDRIYKYTQCSILITTDGTMDRCKFGKPKNFFALNDKKCYKTCRNHVFSNFEKNILFVIEVWVMGTEREEKTIHISAFAFFKLFFFIEWNKEIKVRLTWYTKWISIIVSCNIFDLYSTN